MNLERTYLLLAWCLCAAPCVSATEEKLSDIDQLVDKARNLRELIQSDPHRPIYHFAAPEGQLSDPNGAIYWNGKYHLGYISQKTIEGKRRSVWGHLVSADLLHWTIYPDMLDVKKGDVEEEGIYSGGAFLTREGKPRVVFYGVGGSSNFIAYPTDDDLKGWKKVRAPILKSTDLEKIIRKTFAPGRAIQGAFSPVKYTVFDPEVWYDRKSRNYYQISGGWKPALFVSTDLSEWRHIGDLISVKDSMREPFEDIACPDFFELGEKSMLLFVSHAYGAQYYIGSFAGSKYRPEKHGRMNWPGGGFYAPEQLVDARGRNIIWAWIVDWAREARGSKDYGWSGIMSLPRVVSLNGTDDLQISPAEEVRTIRFKEVSENNIALRPHQEMTLRASGKSIELQLEFSGGSLSPFGVKVFASPDDREATIVRYEPEQEQLVIDFGKSSIRGPTFIPVINAEEYDASKPFWDQLTKKVSEQRAPLKLRKGETLKLDIFLDRSIIEVFANGRQAVTQVVHPELETSVGVRVFSEGEAIEVRNIQSWSMAETNPY